MSLTVTNHIYATYPDYPEGKLAKLRAAVVSSATLADVAVRLDIGPSLALGKGERSSGGEEKPSILADALEAIFGAIYLDAGQETAQGVILTSLADRIAQEAKRPGVDDFKTRLQELVARHFEGPPDYRVAEEGPDHDKNFSAAVWVDGRERGSGQGKSKKEAEQAAASSAWDALAAQLEPQTAGSTS